MEDFHKLSEKIDVIKDIQAEISIETSLLKEVIKANTSNTDVLAQRINNLYQSINAIPISSEFDIQDKPTCVNGDDINEELSKDLLKEDKSSSDKVYDLNNADILVACITGGIAVLVDFLVVKTPKNVKIDGDKVDGSLITHLLKKIGVSENGEKDNWIRSLEKWFHVDYDTAISEHIKGMCPKNHRIFSLGHDPSIMGLIWGVKDIICGTFSYIDKNGVLRIDKVREADIKRLFYEPILWLGHLLSDVFTKAGLPIPGGCALRVLKFGSFGEKDRTIGEIIEYMYVTGYDLRHLATASICNIVIELLIRTYLFLIENKTIKKDFPLFEKEYNKLKNNQKKHKLLMASYSIAVCGNISKIVVYQGQPNAINIPIWYSFAKESISQFIILKNSNDEEIKAIANRHLINERFADIIKYSKKFESE